MSSASLRKGREPELGAVADMTNVTDWPTKGQTPSQRVRDDKIQDGPGGGGTWL